jgi:coiled-coil domain-containing protein 55
MKLSFSLHSSKKAGSAVSAPASSLSRPPAFGPLEDDDASDASVRDMNRNLAGRNVSLSTFGGSLSRTQKQKLEKEKDVDPTVYEYDEVYDQMKEAQMKAKQVKEDDPEARKVWDI